MTAAVLVIARGEPPQTAAEWLAYWWNAPLLGWDATGWAATLTGGVLVLVVGALACFAYVLAQWALRRRESCACRQFGAKPGRHFGYHCRRSPDYRPTPEPRSYP